MQITLIGATGFTGSAILTELVARKHAVKAIVRRSDVTLPDGVEMVRVDVLDTPALSKAFAGSDAVVSAFNPGWQDPNLYDDFMSGSESIQRAAVDAGIARLLVVGGASSLLAADGSQLYDSMKIPEPYDAGVRGAKDYLAVLRAEQNIDWVFLSPPPEYGPMGPKGRRGAYRVGNDHPMTDADGKSTISREDLAIAVVDEIEKPRFHRARFTIGY